MSSAASPQARRAKATISGAPLSTYSPGWRHASVGSVLMEATISESAGRGTVIARRAQDQEPAGLGGAGRQAEGEGRPGSERARDPDLASVQLDELPAEGKPESGTLLLGRAGADLAEFLEHRLLILGGDADSRVADRHVDRPVLRGRPHLDPPPLRRELDGVR